VQSRFPDYIGDDSEDGGEDIGLLRPLAEFREDKLANLLTLIDRAIRWISVELMQPVDQKLAQLGVPPGAPILILPQGYLRLLPLHAGTSAVSGETPGKAPDEASLFMDKYVVSYAPNAGAFCLCRDRTGKRRHELASLVALVDSRSDLSYARLEGEAISRAFREKPVCLVAGGQATRETLIRECRNRTYLHVACHGYFHPIDPAESALILAVDLQNKVADVIRKDSLVHHFPDMLADYASTTLQEMYVPGDRRESFRTRPLTAREIAETVDARNVRIVSLSACQTGFNVQPDLPDEWLGLPAAFMAAGAAAVLTTLWKIDDLSTMLLMERFFAEHLAGASGPVALRKAQVWLRGVTAYELTQRFGRERRASETERLRTYEQASEAWRRFAMLEPATRPFAHPFFWGAFIFNGA
jgi:CHAT domain-containing protein